MKEQERWDGFAHIFFAAIQRLWNVQRGDISWNVSAWSAAIAEQQSVGNPFTEGWRADESDCFQLKRLWYSGIRHGLFQWQSGRLYATIIPRISAERQEEILIDKTSAPILALIESYLSRLAEVP
jgi:hypothetical protein